MTNGIVYNSANWLDQFFTDFDKALGSNARGTYKNASFHPAVDILEEKEDYVLRAELPGVSKENIKVEVKENKLTLSGKKDASAEAHSGEYRYVESACGTFTRSFELPRNVSGEAIKADYQNGVLTLRIPKAKEALAKTIEIQ